MLTSENATCRVRVYTLFLDTFRERLRSLNTDHGARRQIAAEVSGLWYAKLGSRNAYETIGCYSPYFFVRSGGSSGERHNPDGQREGLAVYVLLISIVRAQLRCSIEYIILAAGVARRASGGEGWGGGFNALSADLRAVATD